jgi:hypothetical protein
MLQAWLVTDAVVENVCDSEGAACRSFGWLSWLHEGIVMDHG